MKDMRKKTDTVTVRISRKARTALKVKGAKEGLNFIDIVDKLAGIK